MAEDQAGLSPQSSDLTPALTINVSDSSTPDISVVYPLYGRDILEETDITNPWSRKIILSLGLIFQLPACSLLIYLLHHRWRRRSWLFKSADSREADEDD
jgi:hypothetical protein